MTVSGFVGAYSTMAKYAGVDVKEEKDSLVHGCKCYPYSLRAIR